MIRFSLTPLNHDIVMNVGIIRFLAEDLVIFLQTRQNTKAMASLFEIIRIVAEHLKHN